jgi:suppressor for copper-sensitivity B
MRLSSLLPVLFAVLTLSQPVLAAGPPAPKEDHVQARLYSPVTGTGTDKTVPIALELKLQPKWDTYWRTPGDAGLAPVFKWDGSENFSAAAVRWPAPHRLVVQDLDTLTYTDAVTFPIDVTPATLGAPLKLKLHIDLLVCNQICVPEKHDLSLELPAGPAAPSPEAKTYDAVLAKVPVSTREGFKFERAWLDFDPANKNYVVVEAGSAKPPAGDADLFIENPAPLTYARPTSTYDSKTHKLVLRAEIHSTETMDSLKTKLQAAPLALTYADSHGAVEGTLPLSEKPAGSGPLQTPHAAPLAEKVTSVGPGILLLALLGGLILNLMPCVLPVLSLKILSVLSHGGRNEHGAESKRVFRNFMASSAGIVASFWLMAAVLIGLKATGESVGWGIQFQHPGFLIFLTLVVLFFAANMWGLFEIPLPRFVAKNIPAKHEHEPTLAGHFLTGVFATLLATPCSAPFLGTAVGFALSRGAYEIFLIFTVLGLGLALPYIVLAFSPALFRFLPKPGKWMVTLKKGLAVALLLTAGWLANIVVTLHTMPALDEGWEAFDEAAILREVADGKVVVVDVTADWCLTCKANKRFVLDQPDVVEAMSHDNIVRMQADWTLHDESIAAYLRKFGRYGIPFNVVYGPGAPDGIALPELLTKKSVTDALAEAAGE